MRPTTNNLLSFIGKIAVVTGAGAGIGRAIALRLAGAGATVAVLDKDEQQARQTLEAITQAGGTGCSWSADVGNGPAVTNIIQEIAVTFGRVDILVNNAGIYPVAPIDELSDELLDKVFAVNLRGALYCLREAGRQMQGGGVIINISSIDSLRPSAPGLGAYGASKAALNALTRSAAVEYGPRGIRVNAILPGVIVTEGTSIMPDEARQFYASRTPLGRNGVPDDIAGAVLLLASPLACFVTGQTLIVDGGFTING